MARTRLEPLMKVMNFLHMLEGNGGHFTSNTIEFWVRSGLARLHVWGVSFWTFWIGEVTTGSLGLLGISRFGGIRQAGTGKDRLGSLPSSG